MIRIVVHVCRFHFIYICHVALCCSLTDIVFNVIWTEPWRVNTCISPFTSFTVRLCGSVSWWSNRHTVAADISLLTSSHLWSRHYTFNLWGLLRTRSSLRLLNSSRWEKHSKNSVSYAFKARQHSARLTHAIAERKWPHILVVSKQPTYVLGTFQRTWRQQARSTTLIVPLAASACDSDIHARYM